jgi:hypothetical protein
MRYARAGCGSRLSTCYTHSGSQPSARERGGFGQTLADRTQRIDVTGHVVAGFIKTLHCDIKV